MQLPLVERIKTHISSWTARQLSLAVQLLLSSSLIYSLINFWMSTFLNIASHQWMSYVPLSCVLAHLWTPTKLSLSGRCLQTEEEERFTTKRYFYFLGRVWSKRLKWAIHVFNRSPWGCYGLVAMTSWKFTNLQPHSGSVSMIDWLADDSRLLSFSIFVLISVSFACFSNDVPRKLLKRYKHQKD